MSNVTDRSPQTSHQRLESAYHTEKPKLLARLRKAGRTIEAAEDLVHDVYVETIEKLSLLDRILNLPAWINALFTRRAIDAWRHERVREKTGEIDVAEETLAEIIAQTGLDPLDEFVRDELAGALDDAIKALPRPQREIVEAQVFGGKTFREISESTGENIDTLMARKRYALQHLAAALKHWIEG